MAGEGLAMQLLEVSGLTVEYPGGVKALSGLNFTLHRGEIIGLLGANGAGKTTLIKSLCGLVIPKSGEIRWRLPEERAPQLGVLLEGSRAFYWNLTGWENAEYFASLKNLPLSGLSEHLEYLFRLVGLWEARNRVAGTYSSGMKKRLSLLIALLGQPDLLLLDEPTSGVDRASVYELESYLKGIAAQGTSVVCATHVLSFAFTVASRMLYLESGRLRSWDWTNVLGRHRRAIFLLGGDLPIDDAARCNGYLHFLGDGRWHLEGETTDTRLFETLYYLLDERGFHLLQLHGVD